MASWEKYLNTNITKRNFNKIFIFKAKYFCRALAFRFSNMYQKYLQIYSCSFTQHICILYMYVFVYVQLKYFIFITAQEMKRKIQIFHFNYYFFFTQTKIFLCVYLGAFLFVFIVCSQTNKHMGFENIKNHLYVCCIYLKEMFFFQMNSLKTVILDCKQLFLFQQSQLLFIFFSFFVHFFNVSYQFSNRAKFVINKTL